MLQFKGSKYWRFTGTRMDPGYPKVMVHHFRGIPDHVDSAFVWFGQFYFTKGKLHTSYTAIKFWITFHYEFESYELFRRQVLAI